MKTKRCLRETEITLACHWCGKSFKAPAREVRRHQKEKMNFFCSGSCAATYGNAISGRKKRDIIKKCPLCGLDFLTKTGAKSATFCSRSCASKGSVTVARRVAARGVGKRNLRHDTPTIAASLRSREFDKYVALQKYLSDIEEPFCFEFPVGAYIYDLALLGRNTLVEFDGKNHDTPSHKILDAEKTKDGESWGWVVCRIPVKAGCIINPECLFDLLSLPDIS